MKLKEHLVARKVVKDEINRMIEDFQSKDPTLRDKEWSSDGKNYSFKQDVFNKTGIELTDKYIKHNIISEISVNNFIDVIYPYDCVNKETDEINIDNCIRAIKGGHLYWVFILKDVVISTYRNKRIVDFNIGDIYLKLEPLSGEFYIVKSLHEPMEFTYRDERVITLYDKYMNGEIK